ncbi:unnamed protein product, partial [Strongylus vulgaris]
FQSSFADELEELRKISYASTASSTRSAEEILRKHSMDPDEYLRKASCISDCYYDLPIDTRPKMSDAIPHINIGREYQARVRKWNDRKIHASELEAIEDRDEIVFSPDILRDIEKDQSNIEAAVADLLRSDTLDWEQYQIIYGSSYLDSNSWTPEEVNAFQDAIYKTEKDFHQVAQEDPFEYRGRAGSFLSQSGGICVSPLREPLSASISQSLLGLRPSPPLKDLSGLQRNYQPSAPRTQPHASSNSKKGAQPSADGFFHCRLCDKCFEKVKSLNAHMKSHAMKARAEAEAKAQVDAQLAAHSNPFQNGHLSLTGLTTSLQGVSPTLQGVSPSLPGVSPSLQGVSSALQSVTNSAASGLALQQVILLCIFTYFFVLSHFRGI